MMMQVEMINMIETVIIMLMDIARMLFIRLAHSI